MDYKELKDILTKELFIRHVANLWVQKQNENIMIQRFSSEKHIYMEFDVTEIDFGNLPELMFNCTNKDLLIDIFIRELAEVLNDKFCEYGIFETDKTSEGLCKIEYISCCS